MWHGVEVWGGRVRGLEDAGCGLCNGASPCRYELKRPCVGCSETLLPGHVGHGMTMKVVLNAVDSHMTDGSRGACNRDALLL